MFLQYRVKYRVPGMTHFAILVVCLRIYDPYLFWMFIPERTWKTPGKPTGRNRFDTRSLSRCVTIPWPMISWRSAGRKSKIANRCSWFTHSWGLNGDCGVLSIFLVGYFSDLRGFVNGICWWFFRGIESSTFLGLLLGFDYQKIGGFIDKWWFFWSRLLGVGWENLGCLMMFDPSGPASQVIKDDP